MAKPLTLEFRTDDPGHSFATVVESYNYHLQTGRYGHRCRRYVASVVHFGHWLSSEGLAATNVDEVVIGRFLSEHLPRCECPRPVPLRMIEVRAALNLLLRLLRAHGIAAIPATDEIERELAYFDAKMVEVWGLSRGTRDHRCRIIRRFLHAQFGERPIVLASIGSTDVRSFVLGEPSWSASTIRVAGGAVRCWLRYRALLGEKTAELQHAVPSPAYYRQTSLPNTLSESELNELFASFELPCPSRRRGYAMVRCLADLGPPM